MSGWIGVDFDATLAHYTGWCGPDHLGAPIPAMVARVKAWLAKGTEVRIFTARANDPDQHPLIEAWCREHIGHALPITATKDYSCIQIWDDRAIQVIPNTGQPVAEYD